ncbi:MAG: transcription antitermination factor NusA-like protein [Colwellia sp.]|jgi:transcription antitermination factor NusA-like protein
MKETLKKLSEIVAQANDIFYERNKSVDTLMGIMDKTLRKQGMQADAITIDCIATDKKIVLVLHDSKPDLVDIALGDKAGVVDSASEHLLKDVTIIQIIAMMEENFLN